MVPDEMSCLISHLSGEVNRLAERTGSSLNPLELRGTALAPRAALRSSSSASSASDLIRK